VLSWERYADRWAALHGGVDPRRGRPEVRRFVRAAYQIGKILARLRVPPAAVTAAGLLLAVATPILAVRHGAWPALAALLVLASAAADGLDGAVAVLANRTSALGYVYDAVADRLSELCWLIALWLVGVPGWLAVLTLLVAWLHEYVRARATGAGMAEIGVITLAERPVRVALAAAGLLFAALGALFTSDVSAGAAALVAGIWVVLGLVGLVQLLIAVVRLLRNTAQRAPGPALWVPATDPATAGPAGPAGSVHAAGSGEVPTEDLSAGDRAAGEAVTLPLLLDPRD
jgi:CDP-diacylglycerol--glycerol-3-phosphate 3-phosphatidyltransferase